MNNLSWEKPLDLSKEEAIFEANKCLSCKKPLCETGCPISMRIRDFILKIKEDDLDEAKRIIDGVSELSNICSVVCDHERQCIGHCIRNKMKTKDPVKCGPLEKYVQNHSNVKLEKNLLLKDIKVAVIGAGPAGIAAAKKLLRLGAKVDLFEKESTIGGVLTYGIPSFRLSYKDVLKLENDLKELGCNIYLNHEMHESDLKELKEKYNYVFISVGLTKVKKLGIENDDLNECLNALEFLKETNYAVKQNKNALPKLSGKVLIVGAGNVAMDAARVSKRLTDGEVTIVYRRSLEEAPASKKEIEEAQEEGIEFKFLTNPVKVYEENGHVCGIKAEIMELSTPDESGRRRPVGTNNFIDIKCNYVISAIGQSPDLDFYNKNLINVDHGYIKANDSYMTNIDNVYVGGDITLGAQTVVLAVKTANVFVDKIIKDLEK